MQITAVSSYRIDVTQEEFNLIGLALCGRLKPDQVEAALDLNRRMLEGRKRVHLEHVQLAERALESLEN